MSLDDDLREEIESHLAMRAAGNQASGMDSVAARDAARRQFGNRTWIQEEARSMHVHTFFETIVQDLRYALRGFRQAPTFTLTAVFALALGIGATTAVFSVVDRILFRALPYPDADRLVSIGMMAPLDPSEFLLPDAYMSWRDHQTVFDGFASATMGVSDCDLTSENPQSLACAQVESTLLPTLGIQPMLGRNFTRADDQPNAAGVALISYGLWKARFAEDRHIVGKPITLDAKPVTVVGVLPTDFEMPAFGRVDILIPQQMNEATESSGRMLRVFARLKPGVTIPRAEAAMQSLFQDSLKFVPPPFRKEIGFRIRTLRDRQVHDARLGSWILFGAVVAVLLIACANVANLLLARGASRQQEHAVRAALGAGRMRLMRQALTESLLLSLVGGVAGCALACGLLRVFSAIAPVGVLRLDRAAIDARVLGFTLFGALLCGLLFGLAPAFVIPRAAILTGQRSVGARRQLFRQTLVSVQLAVSLVLLTGASLLLRSLWNLQNQPLGFNAVRVTTASFVLGRNSYSDDARQLAFFEELEQRLERAPGVAVVGIGDSLPPSGHVRSMIYAAIEVQGRPKPAEGTGGMTTWRYVTPGYFAALGIPIVRGRGFLEEDRAKGGTAVILSESLAGRMFPGGDPLGRRIRPGLQGDWLSVVGVSGNVKNGGLAEAVDPEYYVVRKHGTDGVFGNREPPYGWRHASVIVRSAADPRAMANLLRSQISAIDSTLPVDVETMQQHVRQQAQRPRFNAMLLSLFAGMGVFLAAVGLYGVMSFAVAQRTAEIGVRMALGATPGRILKLVLSSAARWTALGALAGLAGSVYAARWLGALLFQVPPADPYTLGGATLLLCAVALLAAWAPARRAARVDPMLALRRE